MNAQEAIAKMERVFGRLIKDPQVTDKWITWRSIHRASALAAKIREAQDAGIDGLFIRPDGRANRIGCLNPEHPDARR